MGHSHEGVSGDVAITEKLGKAVRVGRELGRAAGSSVLATQAPDGRASLPARFALHVRLVVTAWSKALVDITLFPCGVRTGGSSSRLRRARVGGCDEKTFKNPVVSTNLVGVPDLPSPRLRAAAAGRHSPLRLSGPSPEDAPP